MASRQSWVSSAFFLAGCVVLAVVFGPRSQAEKAEAPKAGPPTPGRYQLAVSVAPASTKGGFGPSALPMSRYGPARGRAPGVSDTMT